MDIPLQDNMLAACSQLQDRTATDLQPAGVDTPVPNTQLQMYSPNQISTCYFERAGALVQLQLG